MEALRKEKKMAVDEMNLQHARWSRLENEEMDRAEQGWTDTNGDGGKGKKGKKAR